MAKLPLIEFTNHIFNDVSLKDCYLVCAQHILETTLEMFEALIEKGLNPNDISVIGKCYSSSSEVFNKMKQVDIDVCETSFYYDSHNPFDNTYHHLVNQFLRERQSRINSPDFKKIIVLDDGGEIISQIDDFITHTNVLAIEQTSSGYQKIRNKKFDFPIINVARSYLKLEIESEFIAEKIIEEINHCFIKNNYSAQSVLIIGNGSIGSHLAKRLSNFERIMIYDIVKNKCSDNCSDLKEIIPYFNCIIGTTGTTSVNKELHPCIAKNTVLISASSSDREFDAVYFRKKNNRTNICHTDTSIDGILLANNGFPINFTGHPHSVDPTMIQLTRAMLMAAIYQGINYDKQKGLIELDENIQNILLSEFEACIINRLRESMQS